MWNDNPPETQPRGRIRVCVNAVGFNLGSASIEDENKSTVPSEKAVQGNKGDGSVSQLDCINLIVHPHPLLNEASSHYTLAQLCPREAQPP